MIVSVLKNTINLLLNSGKKIKSIHITEEDLEEIKKQSYVELKDCKTMFGYPIVISDYTHIEVEE